jgi:hypothetical protein
VLKPLPGGQLTLAMLARRRQVIALDRLLTDLPQTMDVIAYRHRVLPLVRHGTGGLGAGAPAEDAGDCEMGTRSPIAGR